MPYDLDPRTPNSPVLPQGYRLLWNEIRQARKPHELDCGCTIRPGVHYHAVGVKIAKSIVYHKRHVWECPNNRQPCSIVRN